jgi:hypothetical protein
MAGYGRDGYYEVGLTVMEPIGRKLFSWCSATCLLQAILNSGVLLPEK